MTNKQLTETAPTRKQHSGWKSLLHSDLAGGLALIAATCIGLLWANLGSDTYRDFWSLHLNLEISSVHLNESFSHLVNDGLMVLFFFVIGLEIKKELVIGELRDPKAAGLPVFGALGGMILPAIIFVRITGDTDAAAGWGIPVATDIAFVLGILALLGSRVPSTLRLFLLTLAVADDVGAIVIIAVFYSAGFSAGYAATAIAAVATILFLRRSGVMAFEAYIVFGLVAWYCLLESGIHATIAGVVIGLLTPAGEHNSRNILDELLHILHPISSLLIVPIFAVANTGIVLSWSGVGDAFSSELGWAVILGLLVGKTIGITAFIAAGLRWGVGHLPQGLAMRHVFGGAALAGIGFTVSLFITELAYDTAVLIETAKIGILAASIIAGITATALLITTPSVDPPIDANVDHKTSEVVS